MNSSEMRHEAIGGTSTVLKVKSVLVAHPNQTNLAFGAFHFCEVRESRSNYFRASEMSGTATRTQRFN